MIMPRNVRERKRSHIKNAQFYFVDLAPALLALFAICSISASAQTPAIDPADSIVVAPPVIPDKQFSLLDFGGSPDGKTLNTDAFKKAVAAITSAGGGHLNVPPGTFLTLPFNMTSHMDLHLEAGSTIKAPEELTAWGLPDPKTATQQQIAASRAPLR